MKHEWNSRDERINNKTVKEDYDKRMCKNPILFEEKDEDNYLVAKKESEYEKPNSSLDLSIF